MEVSERPLLFVRSPDERVLTGVCGGLGRALGVNPWVVRLGFFLLSFGAGFGLLAYAIAFFLSAAPDAGVEVKARPITTRHTAGVLFVSVGAFWLVQESRLGIPGRALLSSYPSVFFAVVTTFAALIVLFGPWLVRLAREAADERRERIRTEERAEMSAHLHDSVLNTLALIQRSEAPADVVTLARRQERELRAWMQGRAAGESEQLDAVVDAMVTRIEAQYKVSVESVVVGGSVGVDDRVNAFVAALQEATVNACRHAGVSTVSVYVEVEQDQLTGFVRDQGRGFDRSAVDADRRGIVDSIEGRMRRAGGSAAIRSTVGEGTEAELHLPRVELVKEAK